MTARAPAMRDRRGGVLAVLFAVAVFNLLDRNILLILQEPIRRDLVLTDGQLGALTGLSFALVYSVLAFPVARLADRSTRKTIVGASVMAWSAMTALSGLATSFAGLVVLRMGVAAGEAGSVPASHSMIADLYPPARRPMAFAVWQLSNPLGTMLGFLLGGWVAALLGWRSALIALGSVGLILGPVVLSLREPVRGRFDAAQPAEAAGSDGAMAAILGRPAFRYLLVASALHGFVLYAVQSWSAPFYGRVFALPLAAIATYLAIVVGLAGGAGTIAAGYLLRRLGRRSLRWYLLVPAIADLAMIPLVACQFLVPDVRVSLVAGFFGSLTMAMFATCVTTTSQTIMPPRWRATATASTAFAISVIGLAAGPPLVGLVSDALRSGYGLGADSIRYAVLASLMLAPAAALFFFLGARSLDAAPVT